MHRHGKFLDLDDGRRLAPRHPPGPRGLAALAGPPPRRPAPARQGPARAARRPGDRRGLRPHRGGHPEAARGVRRARPAGGARHRPARPRPARRRLRRGALRRRCWTGERRQIKGALRDQSLIAGIGNAYSDEILHAARMSPFKLAASLDADEETGGCTRRCATTLAEAVERSRGRGGGTAEGGEEERAAGARPDRASPARCAATPSARSPSATPRSSTARPARRAASRSRTGGCPGC